MELYNPKKLGFGCMRLPVLEDGNIDIEQFKEMVDLFLQKGFTYFDTAYMYHGGNSEKAIKEALVKKQPRDSFTIADKLPYHQLKEQADVEKIFSEQMERLGVDYFDFYLLHNANSHSDETFSKFGCWDFLEGLKDKGLAKKVGFSFHDTPEALDKLLTEHPFVDFVQLQINYLDWDAQNVQSGGVYEVARKHGKLVNVMEPVKGGYLATPPKAAVELLEEAIPGCTPSTDAIRFAASLDGIQVVLSGMSSLSQVKDNISVMENFVPLTEEQVNACRKAAEIIKAVPVVGCTTCRYCCDGCPMEIEIPKLISALNNMRRFGITGKTLGDYKNAVKDKNGASDCIGCGQCEDACPQHLPVREILKELSENVR